MTREKESRLPMKYADQSMFEAESMDAEGPVVSLLWMTPDPLGAVAAACMMYEGKVVRNLEDVTDEQRVYYADQVGATHLKAPLEFVKLHFLIEGVDRAFTHQIVRQRTAVFAQESLRFAVKDNFASEAAVPPSIARLEKKHPTRQKWDQHMKSVEELYNYLVANGVPAEDARGMLPHNTTTRLHYATDLRNLSDHAGNRLCTQAQFVWREVFNQIKNSIRDHSEGGRLLVESTNLFKPVCYQLGHCPFTADFDRGCTIRDRVSANAKAGVPSDEWDVERGIGYVMPIQNAEWMLDEKAAWQ